MKPLLSTGWVRPGIIGASLVALGLTAGCSALKLGYRQGPALSYWWLDGYMAFSAEQSPRVRGELDRWFAWHQRSQLKTYAAHLARAREEARRDLTGEQVCRYSDDTRRLLEPALERALPAAAGIVAALAPEQIDHIEQRWQERTREMREEMLLPDAKARHAAAVTRTVKRFENVYGRLSDDQRAVVDRELRTAPEDLSAVFARREARHRELVAQLRQIIRDRPPAAEVQARLREMAQRYDGRAAPGSVAARATAHACEMVAQVHNRTTAAQRRHLADTVTGWETDLIALADEVPRDLAQATAAPMPPRSLP